VAHHAIINGCNPSAYVVVYQCWRIDIKPAAAASRNLIGGVKLVKRNADLRLAGESAAKAAHRLAHGGGVWRHIKSQHRENIAAALAGASK